MMTTALESTKSFGEKIPGFADIDKDDKEILCNTGCLDLMVMRMAYR